MSPRKAAAALVASATENNPSPLILPALNKGEFHAGIAFTEDGAPSHWVIGYLPKSTREIDWNAAIAKHGDDLPNRQEARLLVANAKHHMKPEWYWTSEQYAGDDAFAWLQSFDYGDQDISLKGNRFRVVLVRRVPIQSFSHSSGEA